MRTFNRKRSKIPEEVEVPIEELIAELPEESQIFIRSWQCVKEAAVKTDDRALEVVSVYTKRAYLIALCDIGYISMDEADRIFSYYASREELKHIDGKIAEKALQSMVGAQATLKRTGW